MERSGRECVLLDQPKAGVRGWHLHAYNNAIGNALEIMSIQMGSAYAQLAAEEALEYLSSDANDTTQTLTVYGIDSNGKKCRESKALNGTTVVAGSVVFRYVENAWLDKECAGAITIRKTTGDTYIAGIAIGNLNTAICQHFNGESESYITWFDGSLYDLTNDCNFELRWYPDDADCLDPTDGFEVLDRILAAAAEGPSPPPKDYTRMPIGPLPKGGWIVIYAIGAAASAKAFSTLRGYDIEVPTAL